MPTFLAAGLCRSMFAIHQEIAGRDLTADEIAGVDALVESTLAEMKSVCAGKRVAFYWSGGKDSQVLAWLCEQAGIGRCFGVFHPTEWPETNVWVDAHQPAGLIRHRTENSLEYLAEVPAAMFPMDSAAVTRYWHQARWRPMKSFAKRERLDIQVLGRRRGDRNVMNAKLADTKDGVIYNPLADWPNPQMVMAIKRLAIPLHPGYSTEAGWVSGLRPWPLMRGGQTVENWRRVYDKDRSVIAEAAEYFPMARQLYEQWGA